MGICSSVAIHEVVMVEEEEGKEDMFRMDLVNMKYQDEGFEFHFKSPVVDGTMYNSGFLKFDPVKRKPVEKIRIILTSDYAHFRLSSFLQYQVASIDKFQLYNTYISKEFNPNIHVVTCALVNRFFF